MYEVVLPETARAHYNELLKECAQERRAIQVARVNGKDWGANLLRHLSAWLINTGVRLQEQLEMHPSFDQR